MSKLIKPFDMIYNWAKANSLTPLFYVSGCCEAEILSYYANNNCNINFNSDIIAGNPRNSDVFIVAGVINYKNAPVILRLYEQMPEPKYVMAAGACACSGGVFKDNSCTVIGGLDKIIPVDVFITGCPPEPDDLHCAVKKLQEKIMSETILKRKQYIEAHSTSFLLSENQEILTNKKGQSK